MTVYGMTEIHSEGYDFIRTFIARKNFSPSLRELANAMGMGSATSALRLVRALVDRGLITYLPGQSRSIALVARGEEGARRKLPPELEAQLNLYSIRSGLDPDDILAEAFRDALPRLAERFPSHASNPLAPTTSPRAPTSPELAGSSIR